MDKPILYSYFRSSASYRVRIALYLKNIDFEYRSVHLLKEGGEQNALNYKSINPMSQVPTFVNGLDLMSQSMAILQYIDKKWNHGPSLFPKDIYQNALVMEICELINSGIQPLHNLTVLQKLETDFQATSEKKDSWCQYFICKGLSSLEKKLSTTAGTCCFANEITAADCLLIPQIYGAFRYSIKLDAYPTIRRIYEHLIAHPAFEKAHPNNQPDTPKEN